MVHHYPNQFTPWQPDSYVIKGGERQCHPGDELYGYSSLVAEGRRITSPQNLWHHSVRGITKFMIAKIMEVESE